MRRVITARRVLSAFGALSTVPVVIAIPVVSLPGVQPHPVQPQLQTLALEPLPATSGTLATTVAGHTGHFDLVGASWRGSTLPAGETIQVRARTGGAWSSWTDLTMPDGGPDDGSVDARAAAARHQSATDPLWVGDADGVQARVVDADGRSASAPQGMHLVLVNGGASGADADPGAPHTLGGAAEASMSQPTIYTRAQWGADESLRSRNPGCGTPDYGSTIKMGFIHHTDTANGYTSSSVPSIIRSIYAYHVESNGWCDIGYNFLVDRFGRIWEGRYGGTTKPVIGAHTGGFNTNTFGVSMIGNYTSTAPSSATLSAVERLFAWKLGSYYRNPVAKTTTTAASFSGSRFAAGSTVTFNVVSGHRDADTTTCPGSAAYAKLPSVRTAVLNLMGAGFVAPTIAPTSVRMLSGQSVAIKSSVIAAQSWTLTVANAAGAAVKTLTGAASTTQAIAAVWDATDATGLPVPPGTYTLTLTGASSAGKTALPYSTKVTVTPPVTVTGPATTTYDAVTTLTGTAAPNAAVTVTLQSAAAGAQPVTQLLTASSTGAWKTTFTADNDYTWFATSQGYSTSSQTTKVAPDVTPPAVGTVGRNIFTASGGTVALSGTALPGTTVSGPGATSVPVAADGTWTGLSVTPTTPVAVTVTDSRNLRSSAFTAYAVGAPTATAPSTGYSARTLTVTGNAGKAPVSVQLFTRPSTASTYTLVRTVTAAASGAYSVATTLPSVTASTPFAWRVVTTAGGLTFGQVNGTTSVLPAFPPTIAGPKLGYLNARAKLNGRAVPGDRVTLWTRPSAGGTWTRAATVTASSTGGWAATFLVRGDTAWHVTSPSGTSATGNTSVLPSLHVPVSAARGATIAGWGYALPGQRVAIYRRPAGTTTWQYAFAATASRTGYYVMHWKLTYPMDVQARSHGQIGPPRTIRFA